MSKVVTCPVARFPGTVTLSDPLTYPQSIAFAQALNDIDELPTGTRQELYDFVKIMVPAIAQCVEQCDIDGVELKAELFPSTPNIAAQKLLAWLTEEVLALFRDAEPDDPNE